MLRGKLKPKSKTVLLIDDESPWLQMMSTALKGASFKVITADSGEAALKKLQTNRPDLIVSDVRMPVMNGFDLFEKVRSMPKFRRVPYVFMSSLDDFDAKRVAKTLGVDDYVTKPINTEEVKTIILDLLSRFRTTRQAK